MSSDEDLQTIPARHGTATFVPKGSTIKIVNSSGTQVVDTWAFALPDPPKSLKPGSEEHKAEQAATQEAEAEAKKDEPKKEEPKKEESAKQEKKPAEAPNTKKGRKSKDLGLPSQEDAEAATAKGVAEGEKEVQQSTPQKAGWSSYLPSLRGTGKKQQAQPEPPAAEEKAEPEVSEKAQQKANSRTWGSYLSTGQGFTSYLPSKGAISAFASSHQRDTTKSYAEQLADFSKTPVGAASFSAITGSGAAGSLYAGYSAWNTGRGEDDGMEYLSLAHSRAATSHLIPRVDDVLVSNLRQPMLTFVEDTSPGQHDTLMAACDPQRYKGLGVEKWEEHGSCAENLVLALKELNERAGLKGDKGVGADVTINSIPAPLNLFMNVPWSGNKGELQFAAPEGKEGDYVRFKAERDIVVVMSACPQDLIPINGEDMLPQEAHFIVETPEDDSDEEGDVKKALEKASAPERKKPKKLGAAGAKKAEDVSSPDEVKDKDSKPAERKKSSGTVSPPAKPAAKPTAPAPKAPAAAESKPDAPAAASKKSEAAAPATKPDEPAATPKPKGKPKKLVDSSTGEKKKPRKLAKRPSQATTPSNNGSQTGS